ncbi:MAG TPA: HupE/UreJ family protein, partial [Burkholderiaceae bacterium]
MKRTPNFFRVLLSWLVLMAIAGVAQAHKSSDSYLQIDATGKDLAVRWDIALRDLDNALDIDTNEDGKLTWGEVKAAWPRIQSYAMARLKIEGCPLRQTGQALERRNDGAYAVMFLASDCVLARSPVISYSLFREVDPTHRGIAKVQRMGRSLALTLLDPTQGPSAGQAGSVTTGVAADGAGPALVASTGRWGFLREGIRHILGGYDHVLFLLCLLLPSVMRHAPQGWQPVERLSQAVWPVMGIVSAFTVAHSITLALAATKMVSLPPAVIEPAIAVTIILAALDNVWP